MKFWKNNLISQEHEVHASQILDEYLDSEQFLESLAGRQQL